MSWPAWCCGCEKIWQCEVASGDLLSILCFANVEEMGTENGAGRTRAENCIRGQLTCTRARSSKTCDEC